VVFLTYRIITFLDENGEWQYKEIHAARNDEHDSIAAIIDSGGF